MKMSNNSLPLVLTPIETARLLRVGRGTVYEQIRLGLIPHIRMGRKILVPRAALMKMLEEAKGSGSDGYPSG